MTDTLTFFLDQRTHFPLVVVPGQDFALFWLPLTKVQIEYFLSETTDSQFDRAWYDGRLRNNPRITPEQLTAQTLDCQPELCERARLAILHEYVGARVQRFEQDLDGFPDQIEDG